MSATDAKFTYSQFEKLCGPQLIGSSVPEHLWPTIFSKLDKQIFDAGDVFALATPSTSSNNNDGDDEGTEAENVNENTQQQQQQQQQAEAEAPYILVAARDLTREDIEDQAWLLDHAWTFRAKEARPTLQKNDQLRARVSKMLFGHERGTPDEVVASMWTHVGNYRVANEIQLDEESCWYLLDEVGSAITRVIGNEDANIAMAPLFYPPAKSAFNVVWFVNLVPHEADTQKSNDNDDDDNEETVLLEAGDTICVDVGRGMPQEKLELNKARFAVVWGDLLQDEERLRKEFIGEALGEWEAKLAQTSAARKEQVDALLHRSTTGVSELAVATALVMNGTGQIKVWTDHEKIRDYLSLPQYRLVENPADADIAWSTYSAVDPLLCPNAKYVAEFHYENRFCNKRYLAQAIQETLGGHVPWLPQTFDATLELPAFLGQYWKNREAKVDNWWISKPHAMARSMDMSISDNIKFLMRIGETGPKILCKYVARPATLRGRKFDLRLCALVRSFNPTSLEVYLHDKVWVRTAANQYSQTDFEEYEKHFTVMNYTQGGEKLLNLLHDDFIAEFDKEKGEGTWAAAYERIKNMLRQTFTAISVAAGADELETPFFGPAKTVHRRALYGIDLMLDENLNPFLLEITFSPDVNRACKFFPTFINDVFKTLFDGIPTSCDRLC